MNAAGPTPEACHAPLSRADLLRLGTWKLRYELVEHRGFSREQAEHLLFVRYLAEGGPLADGWAR